MAHRYSYLKISIKTIITNKSRLERISDRDFVVVDGLAVHGDSSMNRIFYPLEVVAKNAKSLEGKPAPLSHPKRSGTHVSANDFFTKGAHDIGGRVMHSTMSGQKNLTEIFVDKEFAERTEGGKELVRRLLNGETVGLSTGLIPLKTRKQSGVDQFGVEYDEVIEDLEYDHLAFLLNETPAGNAAGTKVIINSETGESLEVITHDEGGQPKSKQKENSMDNIEIDAAGLSKKDKAMLSGYTANELILLVNAKAPEVTLDQAKKVIAAEGLTVNAADSVVLAKEDHLILVANAEKFTNAEKESVKKICEGIILNSKFEGPDLEGLSKAQLTKIADSLIPDNDFSLQDGISTNAKIGGEVATDYTWEA